MKYLIFLGVFAVSLLSTCLPADDSLMRISVSENSFVDTNGNTIVFKGMNASDPDKLEKDGMWIQAYFNEMSSWGASIVRFPIHPSAWRERGARPIS